MIFSPALYRAEAACVASRILSDDNGDMVGGISGGSIFPGHGIEHPGGAEGPYYGPDHPGWAAPRPYSPREAPRPYSPREVPRPYSPREAPRPYSPREVPRPYSPREAPRPYSPREAPRPASEREPKWTGRIKLDFVDPAKPGIVDVHKIKLDTKVSPVVIDRARAVQVGRHEHQVNKYRYQMKRPTASIDRLLHGHPARERALAGLVANPRSGLANYSFRRLLPVRSPIACGRARFIETSGPRITRIAARVDGQGPFQVKESQGVQIGVWDTQRNNFGFRVMQPELSLAHVLRDRPDLTRTLATALGDPDNQAVRRSLENKLAGAYTRLGGLVSELRGQFHDNGGLSVTAGYAVQLGQYNSRVDKVTLDVRKVVLTGWGSAGALDRERPGKGPEPGLLRNEWRHRQRAGLAGRSTGAGHVRLTADDVPNMIVPPALHTMATVAVSAFTPGRRHLVPAVVADLSAALDTITPFERHADLALKAPVLLHDGMFSLGTRPAQSDARGSDESLPVTFEVELSRPGWAQTDAGADRAMVLLLDAQAARTAVHEGYQAADVVGGSDVIRGGHNSLLAAGLTWPAIGTVRCCAAGTRSRPKPGAFQFGRLN